MIYGFVRQSGGQVRIYSEVGKGAILCLYLPRHHGKNEAVEELARLLAEMPQGVAGQSVLVVGDEPSIRMLVGGSVRAWLLAH
jgi:hypothetical protein